LKLSQRRRYSGTSGFTLIEALVALAIVVVALAAMGSLIATVVKGTRSASQRVALTATAETLLNELPARNAIVLGRQSGEYGGTRWTVDISPMLSAGVEAGRWTPFLISIQLRAPNGPTMKLTTVRLVAAAQR
jgi:general secretion pathway protein I